MGPCVRRHDIDPLPAISGCSRQNLPALCPIAGSRFPPNKKIWEEIMTNLSNLPDPQAQARGFDRRNLIKGAAALAATAVTMKAASAASVTPFGQTGAPTRSTGPLPLGPLPGTPYPESHLASAKPKLSFLPN